MDLTKLERAWTLATDAMWSINLQHRRIHSEEPEDNSFLMRVLVDIQFYIIALNKLPLAIEIISDEHDISEEIKSALDDFKSKVPGLRKMRNVIEHIDKYSIDEGREKTIPRQMIHVQTFDGENSEWLGIKFNINDAYSASENLYAAFLEIFNRYKRQKNNPVM
jgi:hypothetical protein